LWYSVNFINKIEQSDSIILVILGNLDHFSHSIFVMRFPSRNDVGTDAAGQGSRFIGSDST